MRAIILGGLLALLSFFALADGATFITAGPPLSNSDPVKRAVLTGSPAVVKLHPVTINKGVFGANILTVDLDGKHFRFVGTMQKQFSPAYQSWYGVHGSLSMPNHAELSLTKEVKTGDMLGQLITNDRVYEITASKGHSFVVEKDPAKMAGTVPAEASGVK